MNKNPCQGEGFSSEQVKIIDYHQKELIMEALANVHPGEILSEEFLKPMNITAYKLSKDIGIPQTRTSAILKGVRGITADTALRLSLYFGTSPKFWLGLQDDFDLEEALKNKQTELNKIKKAGEYAA